MKTQHDLVIRLLQESKFGVTHVVIKTPDGKVYPIDTVHRSSAKVPYVSDDLEGPLSHNEDVLVITTGHPIRQRVSGL